MRYAVTLGLTLLTMCCTLERSTPDAREAKEDADAGVGYPKREELGVVIGIVDEESKQSVHRGEALPDDCPLLVFIHVGSQDKPIPPLVAYVCGSKVAVSRRVAEISGEQFQLPRLVRLRDQELLQVLVVVEERVGFQRAGSWHPVNVGAMGTFEVVRVDEHGVHAGRLPGTQACAFFSDVKAWFPAGGLNRHAQYYRQVLRCDGPVEAPRQRFPL